MENQFDFSAPKSTTLTKRPNAENQRKKTFSISLYDFVDLVQARYTQVEIYDSNNRLKYTLSREALLSGATITPFINHANEQAFFLVNYAEVK